MQYRYYKVHWKAFNSDHGIEASRREHLIGPTGRRREPGRPRICTEIFKSLRAAQRFAVAIPVARVSGMSVSGKLVSL